MKATLRLSGGAAAVAAACLVTIATSRAALRQADLPPAAARAVAELFADGAIDEVVIDRRVVELYELTINVGGTKRTVIVAGDGTVVEVERRIDTAQAPSPVAATVARLAERGEVMQLERAEVRSDVRAVTLDSPRTEYEADVMVRGRIRNVRIAANGRIIGDVGDDDDHDDLDDDGDDDDDDDGDDDDDDDDDDH